MSNVTQHFNNKESIVIYKVLYVKMRQNKQHKGVTYGTAQQ